MAQFQRPHGVAAVRCHKTSFTKIGSGISSAANLRDGQRAAAFARRYTGVRVEQSAIPVADLNTLKAGDYQVVLDVARGGSIARFDWRGEPLMRPTAGPGILDVACFVLVPFSNRIANGVFQAGPRTVRIAPNFPGQAHPHPLHGFGWTSAWSLVVQTADHAILRHEYPAGEWPWVYVAEQEFALRADGLTHTLRLQNLADEPMPAGLGFHPYFPVTAQTRYHGRHRREWQVDGDGLPVGMIEADSAIDWWHGGPVDTRTVDTAYAGREGDLTIAWPERELALTISPSANLPCTVVFTPTGAGYFCAEPVSHATDAINRTDSHDPMTWLAPGETMTVAVHYAAARWPTSPQ